MKINLLNKLKTFSQSVADNVPFMVFKAKVAELFKVQSKHIAVTIEADGTTTSENFNITRKDLLVYSTNTLSTILKDLVSSTDHTAYNEAHNYVLDTLFSETVDHIAKFKSDSEQKTQMLYELSDKNNKANEHIDMLIAENKKLREEAQAQVTAAPINNQLLVEEGPIKK